MTEKIKLKPCPFCGGEARLRATVKKGAGLTIWCGCTVCSVKTDGYCPNTDNVDATMDFIEEAVGHAVKKWNQRAGDTP